MVNVALQNKRCSPCLLDLPEPFRPTNAYRLPAFKRSFALLRISVPSAAALPLPLPFAPFSPGPEVTVMLRPSMSSCGGSIANPYRSVFTDQRLPRGSWGSRCGSVSACTRPRWSTPTRRRWTSLCFGVLGRGTAQWVIAVVKKVSRSLRGRMSSSDEHVSRTTSLVLYPSSSRNSSRRRRHWPRTGPQLQLQKVGARSAAAGLCVMCYSVRRLVSAMSHAARCRFLGRNLYRETTDTAVRNPGCFRLPLHGYFDDGAIVGLAAGDTAQSTFHTRNSSP